VPLEREAETAVVGDNILSFSGLSEQRRRLEALPRTEQGGRLLDKDRNFNIRSFGERTAMNSPLQGSAADLIKIAMINVARALSESAPGSGMVLQVHDELIIEAPEGETEAAAAVVRREMEGAASLKVPLVVDVGIGLNWLDAKR
jgi:DNA polymerase-1